MTSIKIVLMVFAFAFAVFGGIYGANAWSGNNWNDPADFVKSGNVIQAQKVGQNFQYLYDRVNGLVVSTSTDSFARCNFKVTNDIACKYPYNCNCGKYGCSVCMGDGYKNRLEIMCPKKPTQIFNGACQDQRTSQTCGKYGCTSGN